MILHLYHVTSLRRIVVPPRHSGFTPQYTGLQKMYEKFKGRGFEIIGFPCNQVRFSAQ
jgi:glutathione peroxidase-family protein